MAIDLSAVLEEQISSGSACRLQAGANSVDVLVEVDGAIRRHALALRPGHIALLTGLRPLPAAAPEPAGLWSGSEALGATDAMDLDPPAPTLAWKEVRTGAWVEAGAGTV